MKRTIFVCLAVAAAVMAFGAGSASAEPPSGYLYYDPPTGALTYTSVDATAQYPDGHDELEVVNAGWGTVAVQPTGWRHTGVAHSSTVNQYCSFYDAGWSCPATKVWIKTTKANDTIIVDPDMTVPTVLQGGAGIDWIQGGGGRDEIWGGGRQIWGGCSADATCNGFADTLRGGDGDDSLHGGAAVEDVPGAPGKAAGELVVATLAEQPVLAVLRAPTVEHV